MQRASLGMALLWAVYFLAAFFGDSSTSSSNWIWAIVWGCLNIACYTAVVIAITRTRRVLILPALVISLFDIVVCVFNAIVNFIMVNWFGGLWLLGIVLATLYYLLGLFTVFEALFSAPAAAQPPGSPRLKAAGVQVGLSQARHPHHRPPGGLAVARPPRHLPRPKSLGPGPGLKFSR